MNLFNRQPSIHRVEVTAHSHQDVHEHRAPTDASVRLLDEFQDKAFDRLISTLTINASKFEATAFAYVDHLGSPFTVKLRVKFTLGERNHDITTEVDHVAVRSKDELIRAAHRVIADAMAIEVLGQLMTGENRFHLFPGK